MGEKYTDNYRLDIAYATIFRNLKPIEEIPIHTALDITSGDNLTKKDMVPGDHIVYGGGGETGNTHSEFNIDYKTIGIGRVGARCGCVFEIIPNSWVTDNALIIQSYDKRFSLSFLRHFLLYSDLGQYANNAMQPVISKTRISNVTIPLIDIEQQNTLSTILDSIEKNEKFESNDYDLLKSKIEIIDNWETLNVEIEIQKDLTVQLKQSILHEAIQGKLTADWREQNPNTEPASELLKRIKAEKVQLIKDKKIKKGKKQASIDLGKIQPKIPSDWIYCDLDDITQFITDGTHQTPTYTETGRMFLSAQNVKPFRFMPENHKYISETAYEECIRGKKPELGDLLVGRVGSKGETAVINQDIEFAYYVSLGFVKTFKDLTNSDYLAIVMNSPYGNQYATGNMSSIGASAGNYNLGRMRSFPVPFPPLEEQKAIVEKVEDLMQKCQALEVEIKTNEANAQMLMQAVLKEAFEGKQEVYAE